MRALIEGEFPRGSIGAPCKCGGYGDEHGEPTREEVNAYDCGRISACCTASFKCRICGNEFIARYEAPDYG